MPSSYFQRVRRFDGVQPLVLLMISGTFIALLTLGLLIVLGLVMQVMITRGARTDSAGPILGPAFDGWLVRPLLEGKPELRLTKFCGAGLLFAAGLSIGLWLLQRSVQRAALHVVLRLKAALHTQAFRLGSSDLLISRRSRPEELFADRCEVVRQGLVTWWRSIPESLLSLTALLLFSLAVNFYLTLFVILVAFCIWKARQFLDDGAEETRRAWAEQATISHDALVADLRLPIVVTGYGLPHVPGEPLPTKLHRYEVAAFRAHAAGTHVAPLILFGLLVAALFGAFVIGLRVLADPPTMSVAGSVSLGAALICAFFPAARLYALRGVVAETDKAAEEILRYLEREPSVGEIPNAKPLERLSKAITLDRVTLADRQGKRLLDELSLTISANQHVAIVSSDSQVPLSLAGLLVRYYDAATGRILYDGHDIRQATLDTLRGQAMLVPANGTIFHGTVTENIACGDAGFTTLQISDAAKRAKVIDFILSLPQGFATPIGEGETHLPATMAFRIGLARALLRDPTVLVIEETHEVLDAALNKELDEVLQACGHNRTMLVLPSRLSTIRTADQVMLIHEGKLYAQGTHTELLHSSELYRHINYVRFNPYRDKVQ